jgi:8-amino-7-oxononanoate synthase
MLSAEQAQALREAGLDLLQSQSRHLRGLLPGDHHDPHLCGPARDAAARPRRRAQGLLRRHPRHGRDARGPRGAAAHPGDAAGASRERADQPARAGAGHAAGGRRTARPVRVRPHDRRRAHPDARLAPAAVRGPHGDERRDAGAGVLRRRQLDVLWREAADHAEPGRRRRHGAVPAARARAGARPAAPVPTPRATEGLSAELGRLGPRASTAAAGSSASMRISAPPNCWSTGGAAWRSAATTTSGWRATRASPRDGRRRLAWGAGSGAAHLVTGHTTEHHALEEELAEFTGLPRALLFSTGYMANLGLVCALAGRGDLVVEDRLNHASLIDASRLSGATVRRFAHADPAAARRLEGRPPAAASSSRDGVFSMDGDVAPLDALARVAAAAGAEPAGGRRPRARRRRPAGAAAWSPRASTPARSARWSARSARPSAPSARSWPAARRWSRRLSSGRAAISTPRPRRRRGRGDARRAGDRARGRLAARAPCALVARFRRGAEALGLRLTPSTTPIQPVIAGDAHAALAAAEALLAAGLWVTPIRPPTVPAGSARLRITFSAAPRRGCRSAAGGAGGDPALRADGIT